MADDPDNSADIIDGVKELATEISGIPIPAPLKKGLWAAVSRLGGAAIDIPAAKLESIAADTRAETAARGKLIDAAGDKLIESLADTPGLAHRAQARHASKILREQVTAEDILRVTAEDLSKAETDHEPTKIGDDWWNVFEAEALTKSSEDMKLIFGRILSGEIQQPGKFSLKTIRTISTLDQKTVALFLRLCGLSMHIIFGHRVDSLGGKASHNSLEDFDLNFLNLNKLQEHGLINPDFDNQFMFKRLVDSGFVLPYAGRHYRIIPLQHAMEDFSISGISFTSVGNELYEIVDRPENPTYTKRLLEHFEKHGFQLKEIIV